MKHFWLILREDRQPDGGCAFAALACFLVVAAVAAYWGSFNFKNFSPGAILFFIVLVSCCILGSVNAYRDDGAASFSEIAKRGLSFYVAGAVFYAVGALIELAIQESGGFFDIMAIVFGAPLVMTGACLPLLVMQSAVIRAMKK